jgi:methylenetetrahydrofolate reductase (NADPH)
MDLRETLEQTDRFVLGVELVSTRGVLAETRARRTLAFGEALAVHPRVDWVSITDNAGGNPQLAPAALGRLIHARGRAVVIHLSCKDFNRNGLESEAWHLASEGLHNLLALSGDASGTGIAGGAKPVFDIDSVGLLTLLGRMNAGLRVGRPGSKAAGQLAPTRFYSGCVVTNFKLHENEVVPQLLKLEQKIVAGARWVVNQIGYDARKMSELIAWMRLRGLGEVPLIGNVYLLNPAVVRLFRSQQIPGVVISDALAAKCEEVAVTPDHGRAFFRDLAAKQLLVYRGLGYRGAYLGGVHDAAEVDAVLHRVDELEAAADWRSFVPEVGYSRPGEFFCFEQDSKTGLCDPQRPVDPLLTPLASTRNLTLSYRVSRWAHEAMFTPGRGLFSRGAKLCAGARDPMQGPGWMRAIEHTSKRWMFGCKDCGDCSLSEIGYLCPESACAKNQRNGPCGGTRDGLCEVGDFECIWSRAYDRAKYEGRPLQLLSHAPVVQDQNLRGTSSWANTWLGRDHLSNPVVPPVAQGEPAASTAQPPTPHEEPFHSHHR